MPFQFWPLRVQCSQSSGAIVVLGLSVNHRSLSVSHAIGNACNRPPGNGTRYCCNGPSVNTKKPSSLRENREVMPPCANSASSKSPSTVSSVAKSMALS
jgi:hypothetical protein